MSKIRIANKDTGPLAIEIHDEEITKPLKQIVLSHWQMDGKEQFFPAPQPVSLERRDIQKLVEYEYYVCAKSDGMRFLLMCYDNNSYMIDRAFKFYKVNLVFEVYNKLGGMFDGELVINKEGVWKYIIHDCINYNGKDVSKEIFPVRYSEIKNLLKNMWIQDASDFKLSEKIFFDFNQLDILNKLIIEDKLDHKTDGLIFTPKNKKIGVHTQYDLFKWKPRNLHTFDFKIIKNEDGILAYANKNGIHVPYAHAPHGSKEEKIFIESLNLNCPDFVNKSIVECDFDDQNDIYRPIKLRLDKVHPNSFFTIQKTLVNIKENILVEELIEISKIK